MKRGRVAGDKTYTGISGRTNIVFTPHPDYLAVSLNLRGLGLDEFAPRIVSEKERVQEVESVKFNVSGNFKCLGMLTISARKQEAEVSPFSTILSDAQAFPLEELIGFPVVVIASSYSTITETRGVVSRGVGAGASGGGSQILGPLTEVLGLGASFNGGAAFPESKLGATFLVLAHDPNGVFIDLSDKKPEPVAVQKTPASVPLITPEQLSAQQNMLDDMSAKVDAAVKEVAGLVAQREAEAERKKAEAAAKAKAVKAAGAKAVKKLVVSQSAPQTSKDVLIECKWCYRLTVTKPK
jgi:hypothetical protein